MKPLNAIKKLKNFKLLEANLLTLIFILAVVVAVFSFLHPTYLTTVNTLNILYATCVTGLLAIGVTYIIISGYVDLSCGAIGAVSSVLVSVLISRAGVPWLAALLITLLLGATVGAINAVLTNIFRLQPFIATLAMASVCEGTSYLISGGRNIPLNGSFLNTLGGGRILGNIPIQIFILIVFYIIFSFVLSRTTFGRSIYIVGGNPTASRLAGLNPKKITSILYIMSGMLASLAGCLLAGRMRNGAPNAVMGSEFDAIIGAVLGGVAFGGGKGTLSGCLVGLLIIQCFNNGLTFMGISSFWQIVAKGLLLVGALLVDYFRTIRAER